ncbi:MAG: SLC13 family permease [Veillonella sp.]|uniref:SLC13 family permease n=1 Tax=Veillonella TaxID=29465 RepID=UPI0023B08E80|nr:MULTISPECIES: SLC13 family permease [Veillonella]MDE8713210.1 SLC13 family permease [Veillonella atypica]MDU1128678.1 SLC13 family permease [Veillonella sp.]MDU5246553.1 SLC13 family permease [Veillonella sp.]MDU8949906.1 SLC13 family permease [Veillonella sp.]
MGAAEQTLIVLAVMAVLFVTEIIPLAITSLGGAITLGLMGIITPKVVFSGLSDSTVVLFAGMFVVGAALFYTGLAQKIGETVVSHAGTSENGLMLAIMLVTATMSAFLSNTGTTAALLPVVVGICAVAKIPASRQLMPLAFAAGIGGIITMVGTPPNIIVSGTLSKFGIEPFGFFEFAWIGIPLTVATIVFMMLIGKHLLPKHEITDAGDVEQEVAAEDISNDPKKQLYSGIILLGVIIAMILGQPLKDNFGINLPLSMVAVIGAMLCVLTGCLNEKQAYTSIDWVTIFLFAGMMPVATALDQSGAGKMIANAVIGVMGDNPSPYFATGVLFALSCIMTQFMSNTASCALLAPIGISIAQGMGADPHAVLMAIGVAASCAFGTPVGTPPNTLVLGPGQYKFTDYVKAGVPLILVCFVVSLIIIPMVWPFFPGK